MARCRKLYIEYDAVHVRIGVLHEPALISHTLRHSGSSVEIYATDFVVSRQLSREPHLTDKLSA